MAEWNSKVNDVFLRAAVVESPAERQLLLDQQCADDARLRAQVESLLAASAKVGSFLDKPVVKAPTPNRGTADYRPIAERPGTVLGPYKLMEQIGEGGMGLVFVAEQQQPVRRKVALKIIKPGMDSQQVIARFEAERQALALMDHQNIAKVFDAGTTESGRPFFVMELVHGIPITDYCDAHRLPPRERLELFLPVCHAIQHAHQKGIIHRDIKPSNILVTMYDDKPVPKVIDFGVAKAIEQRLTEKTVYTLFGTLVGTFEYMSPEQAEKNAFGVDTRSDVYALGVLLYELLTGTTPLERHRLRETAYADIVRLIKEEEPPRPSTRLSRSGAALTDLSQQRGSAPEQLTKLVRGELDWIVMRCLEKDRTRRYETANGLARDVERYLHDEPVEACPPTACYKLSKLARKNNKSLATAAAFAALLLLGVAASTWQAVRATQAERVAVAERDEKEQARRAEAEQRDVAQQQRDQAQRQRDEVRALNEELQSTLYAAHMNLARHAWEAGATDQVVELLEKHRPKPREMDLRGFEWYYLYRLSHADLLTLRGHTQFISRVAYGNDGKRLVSFSGGGPMPREAKVWDGQTGQELFTLQGHAVYGVSPDGKRLASISADQPGEVKVWDAQTGQELLTFKGPAAFWGTSLVFSPDGKRLAVSARKPNQVKVWDAQSGQELLTLKDAGWSVVFSPDGKRLASAARNGNKVKVWDAQTGQELFTKDAGWIIVFSPDGKRLASGGGSADQESKPLTGALKVWDSTTGQELLSLRSPTGEVNGIAFSPDGKRLASGARDDKAVKVWDTRTGQELLTLQGHTGRVVGLAFSPDGKRLAGGGGRDVKVWDAQTGQELLLIKGASYPVAFSPDGKCLASASTDKTVKVWDAQTGQSPLTIKGGTTSIASVVFSPDGKRLAIPSNDNTVKFLDARTGQELLTLKGHTGGVKSLAFSPDGKRLASGSTAPNGWWGPGEVKVWEAANGRELFSLKGHTGKVHSVSWSPDGKRLASGSNPDGVTLTPGGSAPIASGEVKVWDSQTGRELLSLKGYSNSVAFGPDGKRLASGSGLGPFPGEVKVWDALNGQELLSLKAHTGRIWRVAFSPDGKRLACASRENTVIVRDAQTGEELLTLKHFEGVTSLAYSPDGKRLVSASRDNTVKVWNAQTGEELLSLQGHGNSVDSVAFSPDGHRLAGGGGDGTVMIWDATPLPEKP
jgi:WD40 repeat protein/serine/threonine protein kinase